MVENRTGGPRDLSPNADCHMYIIIIIMILLVVLIFTLLLLLVLLSITCRGGQSTWLRTGPVIHLIHLQMLTITCISLLILVLYCILLYYY